MLNSVFLLFNFLIALASGHLIAFHLYLQKQNLTTYGYIKKKREELEKKPHQSRTVVKINSGKKELSDGLDGRKTGHLTPPEDDRNSREELKEHDKLNCSNGSPKNETASITPDKPKIAKRDTRKCRSWLLCCCRHKKSKESVEGEGGNTLVRTVSNDKIIDLVNVMMGGENESAVSEPQCLSEDKERMQGGRRGEQHNDDSTKYQIEKSKSEMQISERTHEFRRRLDFNKIFKEGGQSQESFDPGHEQSFSLNLRRSKTNQMLYRPGSGSSATIVPFSKNAVRQGSARGEERKGKEGTEQSYEEIRQTHRSDKAFE